MEALRNLDLLSVGIAIAGIGVLGFSVFLNNRKSVTNRALAFFALIGIFWNIFNYLIFQLPDPYVALWVLRFHVFFAVWYCFFLFHFFYVFPKENLQYPRYYNFLLIPVVMVTSLLTLTPLVFREVATISRSGQIEKVINGPAVFLFGLVVVLLIVSGISILLRKIIRATGPSKLQLKFILVGTAITFALHILFNLILPAFLNNPRFVPLGAIFTFPFVAFSAYAILKHHFLGIKVITTEILTFVLSIVVLYEVVFADTLTIRILRIGVFLLVLGFGILLIKSVRKEVEQREKLEILSQQKSEFLSFASHQVKNPMSGVKGFAQLIADGTYGAVPPEVKEKAQHIKVIADRTIALVNNFLDFNKIEEGKTMELKLEDVDIVPFVGAMVEEQRVVVKEKNKDIEIRFEHAMPSLVTKIDQEKMRQVIQNVIDNAVKYTEHGYVRVSVEVQSPKSKVQNEQESVTLIKIEDSGRGLSKELLAKLFGRYVRDEKTKNEVQGTGLGLYIAKSIVEAHHGNIWAESEGEGKGSRFYVQLPKQ